jgi:hypothetical protein
MRVEPLAKANTFAHSLGKPLNFDVIAPRVDFPKESNLKNAVHTWLITPQFKKRLADFTN